MANSKDNGQKNINHKDLIANSILVELGNQTVQNIISSNAISNEIVKMAIMKPDKTNEDMTQAIEQLSNLQDSSIKSLESKIKLIKEL